MVALNTMIAMEFNTLDHELTIGGYNNQVVGWQALMLRIISKYRDGRYSSVQCNSCCTSS